jgi:putative NADPH-quinone reductase
MKILVIKAHPRDNSYCHALADEYIRGAADAGNRVEEITVNLLKLEEYLKEGHSEKPELSQELSAVQESILAADCLVFAYPTWWTTPPALLKLFIEVIFLSGFAYKYHKKQGLIISWDKLLKGKTARLIVTMDAPPLYNRLYIGDPGLKMMKGTLHFCGIKPVRSSYFGSVKMSSETKRKSWLNKAYKLGKRERQ